MKTTFRSSFSLLFLSVFLVLGASFLGTAAKAQAIQKTERQQKTTRILFVLDGSGSMMKIWGGKTRMEVARELLTELVDSLGRLPRVEVGLRVYGHQFNYRQKNCTDSKLEVGFRPGGHEEIKSVLKEINPQGTTPIAYSLEQAAYDFPDKDERYRNVIIMITDGEEACGGDPCAISKALQQKGILLKPFVIGMGIEPDFAASFECMGRFFNAANKDQFRKALREVTLQTLGKTTVSVELTDAGGNKIEKDVNFAFFNTATVRAMYNIVHFRDRRGKTDILEIDPIPTYHLVVYTVPPVVKKNVEFIGGQHNEVKVKTPQGNLLVKQAGAIDYSREHSAIVREAGDNETLLVQRVNQPKRLLEGSYEVEVLTLPPKVYKNVKVRQGKTTTLNVPGPGILTLLNKFEGFASIYTVGDDGKQRWLHDLPDENHAKLNVAIQPGRYLLVYRPKQVNGSEFTKTKRFTITSGNSTVLDVLRIR